MAIPRLKEEQKILATLDNGAITQLVKFSAVRTSINLRRAHLLALTILDTGLRANEALGLTTQDVDYDNLTFHVTGKGRKDGEYPSAANFGRSSFDSVNASTTGQMGYSTLRDSFWYEEQYESQCPQL